MNKSDIYAAVVAGWRDQDSTDKFPMQLIRITEKVVKMLRNKGVQVDD